MALNAIQADISAAAASSFEATLDYLVEARETDRDAAALVAFQGTSNFVDFTLEKAQFLSCLTIVEDASENTDSESFAWTYNATSLNSMTHVRTHAVDTSWNNNYVFNDFIAEDTGDSAESGLAYYSGLYGLGGSPLGAVTDASLELPITVGQQAVGQTVLNLNLPQTYFHVRKVDNVLAADDVRINVLGYDASGALAYLDNGNNKVLSALSSPGASDQDDLRDDTGVVIDTTIAVDASISNIVISNAVMTSVIQEVLDNVSDDGFNLSELEAVKTALSGKMTGEGATLAGITSTGTPCRLTVPITMGVQKRSAFGEDPVAGTAYEHTLTWDLAVNIRFVE